MHLSKATLHRQQNFGGSQKQQTKPPDTVILLWHVLTLSMDN